MTTANSILALDAAGAACSVALWRRGAVVAQRLEPMDRGHSERLVPMVKAVLDDAGLAASAIDLVAVTRGPGGFTGVRIGLSAAKGLALACGCPLLGVSSFDAYAAGVPSAERQGRCLLVAIETKRRDIYVQLYHDGDGPSGEPLVVLPQDLTRSVPEVPLLLAGDAVARVRPSLEQAYPGLVQCASAPDHVEARWVAELAARRPLPEAESQAPTPIYLRAPDVTLPRKPAD